MNQIEAKNLFESLYFAKTEEEVDAIIQKNPAIFDKHNWYPLGGDTNYFGIVRNQQSNPIAALVEKITNSIDAILTKRCQEEKIDPQGAAAPKTMNEAINKFFPN